MKATSIQGNAASKKNVQLWTDMKLYLRYVTK